MNTNFLMKQEIELTASLPLLPAADDFNCPMLLLATCDVPRTRTSLGDQSRTIAELHLWTAYISTFVILNFSSGVSPVAENTPVLLRTSD